MKIKNISETLRPAHLAPKTMPIVLLPRDVWVFLIKWSVSVFYSGNFMNLIFPVYTSSVMSCPDSWSLHLTAVRRPAVQPQITFHSPKGSLREYEHSQKSIFWFMQQQGIKYTIQHLILYVVVYVCTYAASWMWLRPPKRMLTRLVSHLLDPAALKWRISPQISHLLLERRY